MSFVLRDPFFDGFEDMMSSNWPFANHRPSPFAVEDENQENNHVAKRIRRDVITPFSGFGRMDMKEMEKALQEQDYIFGDYIERLWAYLTIEQLLEKR